MTPDDLAALVEDAVGELELIAALDWKVAAGPLEWSCWQTLDHLVDCVFSFALQVAARADGGFLPFGQLHANSDAAATDLITGLRAVVTLFLAVVRGLPQDSVAGDGIVELTLSDWCARAGYEVALHTHDVLAGMGVRWRPSEASCAAITGPAALWMFDRSRAAQSSDVWEALLLGSGRAFA